MPLKGTGTGDTDYSMTVWQLAKTMLGVRHPMSAYGVRVVRYRPRCPQFFAEGEAKEGKRRIVSLQFTIRGRVLFMKGENSEGYAGHR